MCQHAVPPTNNRIRTPREELPTWQDIVVIYGDEVDTKSRRPLYPPCDADRVEASKRELNLSDFLMFDVVTTERQTNAHFVCLRRICRTTTIPALLTQTAQRAHLSPKENGNQFLVVFSLHKRDRPAVRTFARSAILETIAPLPH